MKLYRWQKECLNEWEKHKYRGIVNVITGAGKTVLGISAISLLARKLEQEGKKLRVRIVVPTNWLARQWKSVLEEQLEEISEAVWTSEDTPAGWQERIYREGVSILGGGRKDPCSRACTIYVVNSARYTITRHIKEDILAGYEVLLIADECHHYGAPENRRIFNFRTLPPDRQAHIFTLGLSATPECQEYDTVLLPSLGEEIFRYGFDIAVREETVSAYRLGQIAISFTAREMAEYSDYTEKILFTKKKLKEEYPILKNKSPVEFLRLVSRLASDEEELPALFLRLCYLRAAISQNASARVSCTLSLVRKLDPEEKILIFCERITQAEEIYAKLRGAAAGRIVRYHSDMSQALRNESLEQFRTGEARILVTCRALDEGMDVPSVCIGIVLSCSAGSRQRIQRLGRILRKTAGKESAVLYYLYVKESADDSAYLPDLADPSRIFYLDYQAGEDSFFHYGYERPAAELWSEALSRFPDDEEKLGELRTCLMEGLVRQDFMESLESCDWKISQARDRHERNYWICMKRIQASLKQDGSGKKC